jgi:glutamate-1-semialdehyde 2,1-aminomutase
MSADHTSGAAGAPPGEERSWAARAARVIPGGASTGSKRPAALYGREDGATPTHFVGAYGCRVVTAGGRELTDFTMALGAVALGYADPALTHAVREAVSAGTVSGLASVREVEVAERLCDVIPCAERVRFLKTGAEGVAAAVRLARTVTGRDLVLGSGYFGWLDWSSDAPGVPAAVRAGFRAIPYDDVDALRAAVAAAGEDLAAIVIEPVQERLPSTAWLLEARTLCDRVGAVLVFDEVKTGFRLRPGGYQEVCGVRPHVAVFGKALANGYPLAAVVGEGSVMEAARRTWISSTMAGETVALAAASVVLDRHAREDVCGAIRAAGEAQLDVARRAVADQDGVDVVGIPAMWFLRYADPERETRTLEALVARGVLLKRGAYNFASPAHDRAALARLAEALPAALAAGRGPLPATPTA